MFAEHIQMVFFHELLGTFDVGLIERFDRSDGKTQSMCYAGNRSKSIAQKGLIRVAVDAPLPNDVVLGRQLEKIDLVFVLHRLPVN